MGEVITNLLALVLSLSVGFVVGYSYGEEHTITVALKAKCEQEANESLQELIEDMLNCIDIQIAFERVPERWMRDEFVGRAHELGIEVD